jgi:geranylgeranyl diphosphate synthase type I
MPLDLAPYLQAIEDELQAAVSAEQAPYTGLSDMLRYHLGWQDGDGHPIQGRRGKRLRPLLCLLACEASGGDWHSALPAGAAVELIHNFTLIHDDIEDDSPTRHQRPTVWKVWGLAQGVNAGDMLWGLARQCVHHLSEHGTTPERVLYVGRLLDDACLALCRGQYLDIASEGDRSLSEDTYETLIRGKTAALLGAALQSGALLGSASPWRVEQIGLFGQHLGLAFQVTDDLLGIWGDPAVTGKSAASDLASHKMTLPVIHALDWERVRGEQVLHELFGREPSEDTVPAMLSVLERSGAREALEQRAAASERDMLLAWDALGLTGPAAEALRDLALSIVGRDY